METMRVYDERTRFRAVGTRLTVQEFAALDERASAEGLSRSEVVRRALVAYGCVPHICVVRQPSPDLMMPMFEEPSDKYRKTS